MPFPKITKPIPLEPLLHPIAEKHGIQLDVLRLDKTHEGISGNKWFKLKYNLKEAEEKGFKKILTFGGAFSNHIYATAEAARLTGLPSIGIIRGEEHLPLNHTLQYAHNAGMKLHYMDRTTYRLKSNEKVVQELRNRFGEFYLIPEGGTNELAIQGCKEILTTSQKGVYDYFCVSVGTGGTLAGIIQSLKGSKEVLGFSALKGGFLEGEINHLFKQYKLRNFNSWSIIDHFHFGGYAKMKPELKDFMIEMETKYSLLLDPIYTAKMVFGVLKQIEEGKIQRGSKVLIIHTGGLQGRKGFGL